MAYVVTRLCRDCMDTACVKVCPVDCFYVPKEATPGMPSQLYISPDECIDCGACVPECPWEAIFDEPDTPDIFQDDIALNVLCDTKRDAFDVATNEEKAPPDPAQVAANKQKWGLSV